MKVLALVLALLLPATALAQECAVVTSTVPLKSLVPVTPLEKAYYDAAVCYRQKYLDAESRTRTATTAMADMPTVPLIQDSPSWIQEDILAILGVLVGVALGIGIEETLLKK